MHIRRWLAVMLTGGLLTLVAALGAGAVAADSGGCVVGSLNAPSNTQCVPPASSAAAYLYPGPVYYAPGDAYAAYYTYPAAAAAYYPQYTPAYATGTCCLTTQAGPIVGYGPKGSVLVYDVQGGTIDAYTRDANGNLCEADVNGNCVPG